MVKETDNRGSLPLIRSATPKKASENVIAPTIPPIKAQNVLPPFVGAPAQNKSELRNVNAMPNVKMQLTPMAPSGSISSTARLFSSLNPQGATAPKIFPTTFVPSQPGAPHVHSTNTTTNISRGARKVVLSPLTNNDGATSTAAQVYQSNVQERPMFDQRTRPTLPSQEVLSHEGELEPPAVKTALDKVYDHVSHIAQHGPENHNPYDNLVASLQDLPIILIGAFDTKQTAELSPLLTSGEIKIPDPNDPTAIKTMQASLPFEYVLAASQVAAELGGANSFLTSRVTVWAQDTIPSAGKPPAIKLKTGKGGISGGFIPFDLTTTTEEGPNGLIDASGKQAEGLRPSEDEKDITSTQLTKPLDQVLLGLSKNPPDFIMLSSDAEIQKTGCMEFKVNCKNKENEDFPQIYRIDLCQDKREGYEYKDTVKPLKIKDANTERPSWWPEKMDAKFGDFVTKKYEAFHVDYKKSPEKLYEPYQVYARIDANQNKIPLTGDQDLFIIPRSEKYQFNELAYELVNTKPDGGVEALMTKLKDIHFTIYEQDFAAGRREKSENERQVRSQYIRNFHKLLESSKTYLHALGTLTPYEAYFIIMLNNQVAQVRDLYKDKPEELKQLLERVPVELSMGLKHEKIQQADFDILKPWMKEKPAEMIPMVDAQLAKNRYVSPDILMLQIEQKVALMQVREAPNPAMFEQIKNNLSDFAEANQQWKIWARVPGPPPPVLEGLPPPQGPFYAMVEITAESAKQIDKSQVVDLVIRTMSEHGQNIIRVNDTGITSNVAGRKAGVHLKIFVEQASLSSSEPQALEKLVVNTLRTRTS